ncbi:MAG: ribose 5-phosphate isomerase B [SAR116 cluster bacterium]|nr:ribose 5-phosphate isomerase B [SAR116 cluster bacterium]RPH08478.1 MAG: ribose 5-phosphate isomerase B [Alphaproteobacteria bacterium TMED54]|tara:strand:+ start:430 stop:861 length:432 start_codon:yes stop_codon:yes gene_type:complete
MKKNIFISCDHGGFYLKEQIIQYLLKKSFKIIDLGTKTPSSVDYPDYSEVLVNEIKNNLNYLGILLCGTGIGMSIAANRYAHIRAALCTDEDMAKLSRQHNDANVLVLGGRTTSLNSAKKIIDAFITTEFEKGRHIQRLKKIS